MCCIYAREAVQQAVSTCSIMHTRKLDKLLCLQESLGRIGTLNDLVHEI